VSLLLQLHLRYTQNFGLSQQNLTFLEAKQRNKKKRLKQKQLLEEEEHKEGAKTIKIIAD
jgi:hypothetical protein